MGGSLGTYLGGCGGGTAVHIRASSTASRATWYGVEITWGLRGGLTGAGEVVGARPDEGGEGGGVSNGRSGEASSLRHFSASKFHGGEGVGLQTAGAPVDPPSRISGTKAWRGRKRPR